MSKDEFDFIRRLRRRASHHATRLAKETLDFRGIGDDAAVFSSNRKSDFVITTDLLIEDIDFRRAWLPLKRFAQSLGHKSLAVSLSDAAAMGARPRFALTSIGIPREIWRTKFLDYFYESFYALADKHNVTLIGGDTSQTSDRVVIDSILIGEVQRTRAVMRSGARPGDLIYVTGSLGGARAGLQIAESELAFNLKHEAKVKRPKASSKIQTSDFTFKNRKSKIEDQKSLLSRLLFPTPRTSWGAFLGESKLATAMIDASDGLAADLAHLCRESRVGATIEADAIPVDPALRNIISDEQLALDHALNGGEDYELIFTVRPARRARIPAELDGVPATRIGVINDAAPARLLIRERNRTRTLRPRGFQHFKSRAD